MANMRNGIWKRKLFQETIIIIGMLFLSSVVPSFATAESISNKEMSKFNVQNPAVEESGIGGQIKNYRNDFADTPLSQFKRDENNIFSAPQLSAQATKEKNIILEFNFSEPDPIDEGEYLTINSKEGNSFIGSPGEPMLPMYSFVTKLLLNSEIINIDCKISPEYSKKLTKKITPAPEPVMLIPGYAHKETKKINEGVYNSITLYPDAWYNYSVERGIDTDVDRDSTFLVIHFYPVRYIPGEDIIRYVTHVELNVTYIEPLCTVQDRIKIAYDMVIITPATFSTTLDSLVEHKNVCGIQTKLVTLDEIYTSTYFPVQGRDDQEKIKYFIKNAKENWSISYVLLAGDSDVFPVRLSYAPIDAPEAGYNSTWIPTDLYYADLYKSSGAFCSWDDDKDNVFGEQYYDGVNGIPDVYVGRLPASTDTEMQTVVNKVINYEIGTYGQEWFDNAVFVASDTFGPPNDYSGTPEGEYCKEHITNNYMHNFTVINLYETNTYPNDGDATKTNTRNYINNGMGFVDFSDHGWYNGVVYYNWPSSETYPVWKSDDADSLTNDYKLPVVVADACATNWFDDNDQHEKPAGIDCLGEHFMLNPNGGSIAYLGSVRVTYGSTGTSCINSCSGYIDVHLHKAYCNGKNTPGKMLTQAQTDYITNIGLIWNADYISVLNYNLLGDPSLIIGGYPGPANDVSTESVDTLTNRSSYLTGLHNINTTIKNRGITSQSNFDVACEIKEISTYTETVFSDDMESYTNPNRGEWKSEEWYRDVGDWECGTPTNIGPSNVHSGTNCWGTNLDGNYDNYGQTTFAGFVVDQGWLVDCYGRNDFIDIPAQAGDHIYVNISWSSGADINMRLYKPSDVLNYSITGDNYIAYGFSGSTEYETINYTTTLNDGSGIYKLRIYLWYGGDTSYTINEITVDNVTYTNDDYLYSLKRVDNEGTGYEYPEVTYHYFWVYGGYADNYSISYTFEHDVDLTLYDPDGNAIVGNYYDNDGYWYGSYTADATGLWTIKLVGEGPDLSPDNYTIYVTHPSHYAWLISPVINLTDPNIISSEYSFWHWYNLEENYDYGYVCVGIVGSYWYLSEYYTGNNSEIGWMKETINLDSFIGYKIRLGFAVITDSSVTRPGWYIDDIIVNKTVMLGETTVYGPNVQTITTNLTQNATCSVNWGYDFQNSTYYRIDVKTLLPNDQSIENDEKSIIIQAVDDLPSILLVDSIYGNNDKYFRASLDAKGYSYTLTNPVEEKSWHSVLTQYDVVIWATTGYLTETQQSNLQKYLESSGNLFISGEDIGWSIGTTAFYTNYLHATYIKDDTNAVKIDGIAGDPITDSLTNLNITGYWPDEITPRDMYASTIFKYSDGTNASIKVDTGIYKVVYLACKYFEGNDSSARKAQVMDRIIKWLKPNQPPQITCYNPATDPTIIETEPIMFNITASDPDNDTLIIQWYLNGALVATGDSYTFASDYDSAGTYIVNVTVSDGEYNVSHEWTLTVNNVNRSPVIETYSPETDSTITEEENQTFNITASDPDEYTVLITSWYLNDTLLLIPMEAGSSYTFEANYTSAGWYEVKVIVSDGELSVEHSWILTVTNVNRVPIIDSYSPETNPTITEEETQVFTVNNVSDPDDDSLIIVWYLDGEQKKGIVWYDPIQKLWSSSYTFFSNYTSSGWYDVKVIISDGELGVNHTWILTVTNVNREPVLNNSLPDRSFDEDHSLTAFNLNDYFSDPDGENLNYTVSGNNHILVVINDDGTVDLQASADWYGNETITFRATDPYNEYVEGIIVVTVNPVNDVSIILGVPDQFGVEDVVWTLDVTSYISDVDNTTEELTVTVNSSYVTVNGKILTFLYPNGIITDSVKITVSDGITTANQTITVTITPINDAPTISDIPTQYATEDTDLYLNVSSDISDVDNSSDELTVSTNSSYATVNGFIITFNYPNSIVSENVRIIVSDGINTSYQDIMVIVTPVNDAPVINSFTPIDNPIIDEGEEQAFTVSASDVDNTDLTITWYLDGTSVATGSTYTFTSDYTSAGTYTVKVVVSDGSLTDEKTWTLTVNDVKKEEPKGFIPGFEATILITMIGACVILLRKRKDL